MKKDRKIEFNAMHLIFIILVIIEVFILLCIYNYVKQEKETHIADTSSRVYYYEQSAQQNAEND